MTSVDTISAFEFVTGTLRGNERAQFARQLQRDSALQNDVQFWEQQLLNFNDVYPEIEPPPETWTAIQQRIQASKTQNRDVNTGRWPRVWRPLTLFASLLLLIASVALFLRPPSGINADYVAVLTDVDGVARLTAITERGGETLWLQWEQTAIPETMSIQLWAISERDGQSRSLAVFESGTPAVLSLNETNLRLIRDASHLVLTEEEFGGSAIDEPSDVVLARGECVRLRSS